MIKNPLDKLIENRQIRVFISSTFRDMQDERDELMKKTFPVLRRKAAERDVTLTELDLRWGITPEESESGKVVEICLREIENSVPFFIGIIGNRYGWIPAPGDLGESLRERYSQVDRYVERHLSVTEMEMQFGVLERQEDMHAYFFIKEQESDDVDEPEKLATLKAAVRSNGRYPASTYSSPEDLAGQVEEAFTKLLDDLFPEGNLSELEKERIGQRAYLNSLCQNYIRTESNFAAIDEWMEDWDKHQLVITGASGLGKSALVANWVKEKLSSRDALPYRIIYHFVGNGGSLGSHGHVIKSLCDEIRDRYGFGADEKEANTDEKVLEELVNKVAAEGDKPLLIVLDAINQIIDVDNSKQLNWLPIPPKNVKILFTTLEEDQTMAVFKNRHYPIFTLLPLTKSQRAEMVEGYLDLYSKKLQPHQVDRIIADKQCENTLVLKTLLDELVNFGIFEKLDEKIGSYLGSESVEDFYGILLKGYETDFGEPLVKHVLSLIAVSRNGLSEEEILSITKETPLHWSQFFCSIRQHLIVKNGLISFAHSFIRKAAEMRYLEENEKWERVCRKEIVAVLESDYTNRAMDEVPHQYDRLDDLPRLYEFLLDSRVFTYLKKTEETTLGKYWRKLIDKGGYSLTDYLPVISTIKEDKRTSIFIDLSDFSRIVVVDPKVSLSFIEKAVAYASDEKEQAKAFNYMGLSYGLLGNPQKALEYSQKALSLRLSLFGENHSDVAESYHNVGIYWGELNDYQKELRYEMMALNIALSIFGENNTEIAAYYSSIGGTYGSLGDYQRELEFNRKSLDLLLSNYGENNSDVAASYNAVGIALDHLGSHQKAFEYKEKALKIWLYLWGNNHPDIAMAYNNVGVSYNDIGDHQRALSFHQKALEVRLSIFGENHSDVADSYNNIAYSQYELGNVHEALENYMKSLTIRRKVFGENNLDVAQSYNNIGLVFGWLGDHQKALEYEEKALRIRSFICGENHPDVAQSYGNVGFFYGELGDYVKEIEFKQKSLAIRLSLYGENHSDIAESYNNIGYLFGLIGNGENEIEQRKKALEIAQRIENWRLSATYFNRIGMAYKRMGQIDMANEYFHKAAQAFEKLGDEAQKQENLNLIEENHD